MGCVAQWKRGSKFEYEGQKIEALFMIEVAWDSLQSSNMGV